MTEHKKLMKDLRDYQFKLAFARVPVDPQLVRVTLDWFECENQKQPIPSSKITELVSSLKSYYTR